MHTQNVKVNVNSATGTSRICEKATPKFIPSPYEKGVSIREDIFNKQFKVLVRGLATFPNDAAFEKKQISFYVLTASTITDAVNQVNKLHSENAWQYKDADVLGDTTVLDYLAQYVQITDRNGRAVLGGTIGTKIEWCEPIKTTGEIEVLTTKVKRKNYAARDELNAGNLSKADELWLIAEVMTLEIVAPIYRGHPEVVQIFDEIYRRECADFIEEEAQMFATE
jgi:predicted Fe-Mo cluster-binding NifX family protein